MKTFYNRYDLLKVHPYKVFDKDKSVELFPPGVTSITGIYAKAAIPQWSANIAAQAAIELKNEGLEDEEIYDKARKRYLELRDDAGGVGKKAHKFIEQYLSGTAPEAYDKDISTLVEAFFEFKGQHGFEWLESESTLMSEKHMYLGGRDALAAKDGQYWTIDFKTGNPDFEYNERQKLYTGRVRAYDAHFEQCAGYDIAESEMNGRISDWYAVVYFIKDPKAMAKKYGIKPQKYFYFESMFTPYWQKRFLNSRKAVELTNSEWNKYKEAVYG